MTPYREQAIRDVAAAFMLSTSYINDCLVKPYTCDDERIAYAVAQRERVLELEAQSKPPEQTLYSEGRCQICGWPFAQRMEDGCVPGSCGMRPREFSEEWFRYKERREWLRENHPGTLEAQLQQKEGERNVG